MPSEVCLSRDVVRSQISGFWMQRANKDYSATYFLSPGSDFTATLTAHSLLEKCVQTIKGNQFHGAYDVMNERAVNTLPAVMKRKIARWKKREEAAVLPEPGLFLRLNYIDLPRNMLNFSLMGVRIPLGNIVNHATQLFVTADYRILEFTPGRMILQRCDSNDAPLTWTRAGMMPPAHGGHDPEHN